MYRSPGRKLAEWVLLAAVLALFTSGRAAAQSAGDRSLAVGYGVGQDRYSGTRITYKPSVIITGTARDGGFFALLGEFGWGRANAHNTNDGLDDDGIEKRLTFAGGLRFSARRNTTPFAQFMVGYARESFSAPIGGGCCLDPVRPDGFIAQPAVGMDIALARRIGIRAIVAEDFSSDRRLFRFSAGLILFFPKD